MLSWRGRRGRDRLLGWKTVAGFYRHNPGESVGSKEARVVLRDGYRGRSHREQMYDLLRYWATKLRVVTRYDVAETKVQCDPGSERQFVISTILIGGSWSITSLTNNRILVHSGSFCLLVDAP